MSESYNAQPLPPLDPKLDVTKNHYWSYHNLEALLSCKKPLTASKDEDLFICVHQIANAEGKLHIAETECDRCYGDDIASWLERYRDRNLAHYYQTLVARATGDSLEEQVANLLTHPQASAILKCMRTYDELQTRFHQAHLGLAVRLSRTWSDNKISSMIMKRFWHKACRLG